jgi:hypothetical protein
VDDKQCYRRGWTVSAWCYHRGWTVNDVISRGWTVNVLSAWVGGMCMVLSAWVDSAWCYWARIDSKCVIDVSATGMGAA